tara:strand:+ start:113 stop:268 length:156 start_codon:yes stop_codon:yes gene_type:complete
LLVVEAEVVPVVVEVVEDFINHQHNQFQLHHIQLLLGLEVLEVQQDLTGAV